MKKLDHLHIWLAVISLLLGAGSVCQAQSGPPPIPTDPDDVLSIWIFDNGPHWTSMEGDAPLSFTNLTIVPSWSANGTALQMDTNSVAWLNYSLTNSDGSTNLAFDAGTIIFWYSPDYTTVPDGGSGPGEWASLFTVGNFTTDAADGCWSLAIDPDATNLVFVAQTNGASQLVFSTLIDWFAGDWHFIVLSYTPTNCSLYLDSELVTNAPPITYWPSPVESAQDGIWVGSTKSGDSQGHGIFQYLATFNYAVDADFVAGVYQKFLTEISDWGGSLPSLPGIGGFHNDSSGPPAPPGGGGTNGGGGSFHFSPQPTLTYTTNYAFYTNFWLTVSNSPTQAFVSVQSTLSNLTYQILTNTTLSPTNWHVWKTALASNSVIGPFTNNMGSNYLFYEGRLVWLTGTNGLPDWWQMLYFHQLGINPNADPMQDGLSNFQKYQMGLNPNVSYLSQLLIEPPGGTNTSVPQIKIFSLTNGTTIRYTTNGSSPSATNGFTTTSGTALTNIPIGTFTLKAWESGLFTNTPILATYTIVAGAPLFSLASGIYSSGTQIQITCLPTNATVRYTTNGSLPTTSSPSILPTTIITLRSNQTINATAWYNGVAGPVSSAAYIIQNAPANDNFSNATPLIGTNGQIFGTTVGATIEPFEEYVLGIYDNDSVWYKWTAPSNGTVFYDYSRCPNVANLDFNVYYNPSNSVNPSNLLSATFSAKTSTYSTLAVTQNVTYYIHVGDYYNQASVFMPWQYYGPSPTPIFVPDAGIYTNAQLVSILCNNPNAIIRYTTNGVAPTTNSAIYNPNFPIFIATNQTLKAAAWEPGLAESAVYSATYTINGSATNPTATVSTPIVSPGNTNFVSSIVFTLTCTNSGAVIHYTLNGNIPAITDPSVSSGGSVTNTNTVVINAKAWVTNMNPSVVATAIYAKTNVDTDHDGIPDTAELLIGSNPFASDASAVNPNPYAHGMDNYQVYQNPSVLIANNYSTLGDGVPDWWKIANGYNISTSGSLIGANGQTLLADYLGNYNPNSSTSQPAATSQIDFHVVTGFSNNLILVLDRVAPSIIGYLLECTDADPSSPTYNQTLQKWIPTNTALVVSNESFGRYYPLPNPQLPDGLRSFVLYGADALGNYSQPSTCFLAVYWQNVSWSSPPTESTPYGLSTNSISTVVSYTNNMALKESVLAQELRSSSVFWRDTQTIDEWYGYIGVPTPLIYGARVEPLATTNYWAVGQFDGDLDFLGPSTYFTNFCSTANSYSGCPGGSSSVYGPLVVDYDSHHNLLDWRMESSSSYLFNQFGLECLSLEVSINNGSPVVLTSGETIPMTNPNATVDVAQSLETPVFHTVNYYYDTRFGQLDDGFGEYWYQSFPPVGDPTTLPDWDSVGGIGPFYIPVCMTNPVIVAQVGKPVTLQTWRNVMAYRPGGQALTNQTFWIEQDLDKAYLCSTTNGDVPRTSQTNYNGKMKIDTNSAVQTGILSPDFNAGDQGDNATRPAEFTPTQTGKVIITTKPGLDGSYGELVVYVIDMQVDANHDGIIDNRDLTSLDSPMNFWVNNDIDRWHSVDITDEEQDDVQLGDTSVNVTQAEYQGPDWRFQFAEGPSAIPCTRDLEDYARLWIPGLSNLIQALPTNYSVTLQWRNNTGAGVRLFGAADPDGGTNYLFDLPTASNQVNFLQHPLLGYVSPHQPLAINSASVLANGINTNDHFIFCGTSIGNDELVLIVQNPYGGVVGEASIFLNLEDIKQMYERWVVGNDYDATQPIPSLAVPASDGGAGPSFLYSYNPSRDSATPYILFVHGWNMAPWEKDSYAETAYKRLYWQGYQGRFGEFRWPTYYDFPFGELSFQSFDPNNFDKSEYNSWQSAVALKTRLTALNIQYPGNAYVMAHSMGNIATGEALRLSTNLVKTYVAMQGAVAAHAYDPTTAPRTIPPPFNFNMMDYYASYWTNGAPCYFTSSSGALRYINFLNAGDWALNWWQIDQNGKPDTLANYSYSGTNFYLSASVLTFPTNTYQIFSFCDQAPCYALGAQTNVGGKFALQGVLQEVDLSGSPYNFSTQHKYHSGQFRSDNMDRAVFWNQILIQMGLKHP